MNDTDVSTASPVSAQPIAERIVRTAVATTTPADLLRFAMEQGADIDKLSQLLDLQTKWEALQARKAYVAAMAEFKKSPPEIFKSKKVSFVTRDGDKTEYSHATLGEVTAAVIEGLARCGFSHNWDVQQPDGGLITVSCIITHEAGHSERIVMRAAPDQSGKKNTIQQVASAITYLQRYTLLAACGLAPRDLPDDDGHNGAGVETVSKEQLATIEAKVDEFGGNKIRLKDRLCKLLKVESIDAIPTKAYADAIRAVEDAIKAHDSKASAPKA